MTTPHTPTLALGGKCRITLANDISVWATALYKTFEGESQPGDLKTLVWVQNPEHAAFIVRACNVHEELLALLKRALPQLKGQPSWDDGPPPSLPDDIKAAITKTEGK